MGIIIKNTLIKTHHFIHMIEQYHGLSQQNYSIITIIIPDIEPNLALQIFLKLSAI